MKTLILCSLIFCSTQFLSAQTLNFTITNVSGSNSLTCTYPTLSYTATSTHTASTVNYTWTDGTTISTGPNYTITSPGTYTVLATAAPTLTGMQMFTIFSNTTVPSATVSPSSLTLNCNVNAQNTINAQTTFSNNTSHLIVSPNGSSVTANNLASYIYSVVAPGTYTHHLIDNNNGCFVSNTFNLISPFASSMFSVSSSQNFTVGCNNKSILFVSLSPHVHPGGGALSYTIIGPGTGTTISNGVLSPVGVYTLALAGTYTYIVKDNTSMCTTILPFTVTGTNSAMFPTVNISPPSAIVSCIMPSALLMGNSPNNNVTYSWTSLGNPPSFSSPFLLVTPNTAAATSTLAGHFTLTVTDTISGCSSSKTITVRQNIFPPIVNISNPLSTSISCTSDSVTLYNVSVTGIPPSSGFQVNFPVVANSWAGPGIGGSSLNPNAQTVYAAGVYTLFVADLNNGCIDSTTYTVVDIREFPQVLEHQQTFSLCPNPQVTIFPILQNTNASYTYSWTGSSSASLSTTNSMSITVSSPGIYTVSVKNNQGCITNASIAVVYCVGMADFENIDFFNVYPNPFSNTIYLNISNKNVLGILKLYDAVGQLIIESPCEVKDLTFDTSQLMKGIYFLSFELESGKQISKKLIKE